MGWIILIVVVLILIWIVSVYNGLISSRQKVENAWSQIDVQLQRRFDLIPNFVEHLGQILLQLEKKQN